MLMMEKGLKGTVRQKIRGGRECAGVSWKKTGVGQSKGGEEKKESGGEKKLPGGKKTGSESAPVDLQLAASWWWWGLPVACQVAGLAKKRVMWRGGGNFGSEAPRMQLVRLQQKSQRDSWSVKILACDFLYIQ